MQPLESRLAISIKIKNACTFHLAISFLADVLKDICVTCFVTVLFVIMKAWKQMSITRGTSSTAVQWITMQMLRMN